jgi:hypothetical protein
MNFLGIFTVFLVLNIQLIYTQSCDKEEECKERYKSRFDKGEEF